ncbi:hypothetical protein F2Q69_00027331 [Brassica cretica]|uniref:Uncharacterized protein n=1 Tax=Brassica cretica TaxID=69181 RepID=A0A8S9S6J0_BRACR|nr:hypothetical protein F2Q69_00027331 [Brassica cretica]
MLVFTVQKLEIVTLADLNTYILNNPPQCGVSYFSCTICCAIAAVGASRDKVGEGGSNVEEPVPASPEPTPKKPHSIYDSE